MTAHCAWSTDMKTGPFEPALLSTVPDASPPYLPTQPESMQIMRYHHFTLEESDKPATKADISLLRAELATKIELERLDKNRVAVEVVKIGARIDGLQESLDDRLSRHTDRIMTAIDAFAKKVEADNRAVILHGDVLQQHHDKLGAHENA